MYDYLNPSFDEVCRDSHDELERLPYPYYESNHKSNIPLSIDEEECYGRDGQIGMWLPHVSETVYRYRSVIDEFGHKLTFMDTFNKKGNSLEFVESEDVTWLHPDDFERNRLDTCRIETVVWDFYGEHKKVRETKCKNMAGTVFWVLKVTFFPDGRVLREYNNNIKYNR